MAAVATATPPSSLHRAHSEAVPDVPEARAASPASSDVSHYSSEASRHEDEMATLNAKLVAAINQQTSLDDSLQQAKKELEDAQQKIAQLEDAAKKHQELITSGLLITKEDVAKKQSAWQKELDEEKLLKAKAEKERKGMEQELEALTSQLFEEANQMVAAARKETEAAERRTEQVKTQLSNQLSDNEALLHSQQEQLQDLKAVLEKVTAEKDEENTARSATEPSTPGAAPADKMSRMFESMNLAPASPSDDLQPDHPLRFSHLIRPVLRDDLQAYRDFSELIRSAWTNKPPSRVSSGSYGSLNVLSAANGSQPSSNANSPSPNNGSFSQPHPSIMSGSASPKEPAVAPLKDTKVYKRAAAEDVEPTMRLDVAPGVSWLARRTILNSMAAGSFSIEPMPPPNRFRGPVYPCSLCGENRKGDMYSRKHRFRTAETEDAVRYPLCDPCLGRVRSSCDYISFLRMIRDGHWKADSDDDVRAAWEESVRLRERMFWQRIGGGVVPAFVRANGDSTPRSPSIAKERSSEDGTDRKDPFRDESGAVKRVSIGDKVLEKQDSSEDEPSSQLRSEMRSSMQDNKKSLGISIPAS